MVYELLDSAKKIATAPSDVRENGFVVELGLEKNCIQYVDLNSRLCDTGAAQKESEIPVY